MDERVTSIVRSVEKERPADRAKKLNQDKASVNAIHSILRDSEKVDVVDRVCTMLGDLYRSEEIDKGHGNQSCSLQFFPTLILRYLSLLVCRATTEIFTLIEALLMVICTTSYVDQASKFSRTSTSTIPNLAQPSVYHDEIVFSRDFFSSEMQRESAIISNSQEPAFTHISNNNRSLTRERQEVLTYVLQQYNAHLNKLNTVSHEKFCRLCSCVALSGFNLEKLPQLTCSTDDKNAIKSLGNKRFILSAGLLHEMLQGLYQMSFYKSTRVASVNAVRHITFRAKHSLMANVLMSAQSVEAAIANSTFEEDDLLDMPTTPYATRAAVVTNSSIRFKTQQQRAEWQAQQAAAAGGPAASSGNGAGVASDIANGPGTRSLDHHDRGHFHVATGSSFEPIEESSREPENSPANSFKAASSRNGTVAATKAPARFTLGESMNFSDDEDVTHANGHHSPDPKPKILSPRKGLTAPIVPVSETLL